MTSVANPKSLGLATLLIFVAVSLMPMITFFSIAAIIVVLSLAVFQTVKCYRTKGEYDVRARVMPRLLCFVSIMFSCGVACDPELPFRLIFDLSTAVMATCIPVLSVIPDSRILICSRVMIVIMAVISLYYIICVCGLVPVFNDVVYLSFAGVMAAGSSITFIYMIWRRIRDVKSVMKSGNVWSFVTLCVDVVYVSMPLLVLLLLSAALALFPDKTDLSYVVIVFLLLELVAIEMKILFDSAFVVMLDHERLIVESMKITRVDSGAGGEIKGDDRYKELYERIMLYFEMTRPYLRGDLTINDVVKVVYSNKVYISQAICHYTGRNFRQFVNYHRVMYSIDLFRSNLELKVSDLSEKSGFNNMVSYTMAFRLFMNETPSEWCRKERAKILKPKK